MGLRVFRLAGGSMRPLFRGGGAALAGPGPLRRGDCAVYRLAGRTLLHRVAGFAGGRPVLRDDGWELPPHAVRNRDILGRIVSSNPLKYGFIGYLYFLSRGVLKWLRKTPSSRN